MAEDTHEVHISMSNNPGQQAAEFLRRLKHQLVTFDHHVSVCEVENKRECPQHKLLGAGFRDSTSTLKGLGYGVMAQEVVREHERAKGGEHGNS